MTQTEERRATHTPGPWHVGGLGGAQYLYRIIRTSDRQSITRVERNGEEGEANARLIAAAPLLLEECETVADELESWLRMGRPANALYRAGYLAGLLRAAIAAARGEVSS